MKNNLTTTEVLMSRAFVKPPFNDGYKIIYVLPGGNMSCMTVAGAMIGFEDVGLTDAVDIGFVASGGLPDLSYSLTRQPEYGSTIYSEELSGISFINLLRLLVGKNPIDYDWVIKSVSELKPLDYIKIWESHTQIIIRLKDKNMKVQYLNLKDFDPSEYFDILRASISQPIISKGGIIRGERYFDGQFGQKDLNDHIRRALKHDHTHMVILYNRADQRKLILPPSDKILEIIPGISVGPFETNSLKLLHARDSMRRQIVKLFNH